MAHRLAMTKACIKGKKRVADSLFFPRISSFV